MKLSYSQNRARGQLHRALVRVKAMVDADPASRDIAKRGICSLVLAESPNDNGWNQDRRDNLLNKGFRAWPKFSGNETPPVPGVGKQTPQEAWITARNKWTGDYGAARRELLDFLIDYTRKTRKGE